jgi:hypothetical protein
MYDNDIINGRKEFPFYYYEKNWERKNTILK